jgi:hypothetical protein
MIKFLNIKCYANAEYFQAEDFLMSTELLEWKLSVNHREIAA